MKGFKNRTVNSLLNVVEEYSSKTTQEKLRNYLPFIVGTIVNLDVFNGRARVQYLSSSSTDYNVIEATIKTIEKLEVGDSVLVIYINSSSNAFITAKMSSSFYTELGGVGGGETNISTLLNKYLLKSGGTMSGPLIISSGLKQGIVFPNNSYITFGNSENSILGVTTSGQKSSVNLGSQNLITNIHGSEPELLYNGRPLAFVSEVSGNFLPLSGGEMGGPIVFNLEGESAIQIGGENPRIMFENLGEVSYLQGYEGKIGIGSSWENSFIVGDELERPYYKQIREGDEVVWRTLALSSDLNSYMPLAGGTFTGPISFADSTAIPSKTLSYICGIDALNDATSPGQLGFQSKADFLDGYALITDIPTEYLKTASVNGDTLTLVKQDNTTVTFTGGGSSITVEDNLTSTSATNALSANQGRVLNEKFGNYVPILQTDTTVASDITASVTNATTGIELEYDTRGSAGGLNSKLELGDNLLLENRSYSSSSGGVSYYAGIKGESGALLINSRSARAQPTPDSKREEYLKFYNGLISFSSDFAELSSPASLDPHATFKYFSFDNSLTFVDTTQNVTYSNYLWGKDDLIGIGSTWNNSFIIGDSLTRPYYKYVGGDWQTLALSSDIPTSVNGLGGGTLSSPLTITGGDSSSASKIILNEASAGQITNSSTATLFGFLSNGATTLTVGATGYGLSLRGSGTRPTYTSGSNVITDIALYSDITSMSNDKADRTNAAQTIVADTITVNYINLIV